MDAIGEVNDPHASFKVKKHRKRSADERMNGEGKEARRAKKRKLDASGKSTNESPEKVHPLHSCSEEKSP